VGIFALHGGEDVKARFFPHRKIDDTETKKLNNKI
jgi:hypothetical protein